MRALAVTSPQRSRFAPELPTVAESGVPGYEVQIFWGLFGPAATPRAVIDRINREMRAMQQTEDIKEKLGREGAEAVPGTPEEFTAMMRAAIAKWRQVLKDGNIRLES